MPASTQLSDLRTRVLERANMSTSTGASSGFVSTAELNAIINTEAAELYDTIASAYSDYFTVNLAFTVASGTNTYAMDPTVFELVGVDRLEGTDYLPLTKCSLKEARYTSNRGPYYLGACLRFHWAGSTLYFDRIDASGTYRLWYIPQWVDLVADSDALVLPNNWAYAAIISGSAAVLLAKEESDPSVQLGLKQAATARIMAMAANRDVSGPDRIERTRNRGDDCDGWPGGWAPK